MGRVLKFKAFLGREDIYSVVIASLSGVGCDAYKTGQLQLAKIMKFDRRARDTIRERGA